MSDPLQIHHEQETPIHELREQFRYESHAELSVRLRKTAVIHDAAGNVIAEYKMLDEKHKMDDMYDHPRDFGLDSLPESLALRVYDKAEEANMFEAMSLPQGEGCEHDAPALAKPIENCSEAEIERWVDEAFAASREIA